MESLEELRAALHRDPRGVADKVVGVVAAARAAGDSAQLSRALSVLGRARLSLGEIDLARADLTGAIGAAVAGLDDELAADAHLGLAAVLTQAGHSTEAFDHLDETARLGSNRLRTYALLQRAVVERCLGRLGEALACFDSALPALQGIEARVDLAKLLLNRGVLRISLGNCDAAIADMFESGRLFAAEQDEFGVGRTQHGLGWAYARRGDLPRALQHLDAAADLFGRLGHDALDVDVDRAEVLLAAGLHVDAGDLAERTATRLHVAGDHWRPAEAWLLRCQTLLLDGDPKAAATYAERARAMYADQGASGWEQAAQLEVLRCTDGEAAELLTLADGLRASGNARGAATALALAAVAACRSGAVDEGAALAARCTRSAGRLGLFEVRMQAAFARATCAVARCDLRSARRQVRSALNDLASHRTSLAATDARASVAVHAAELVALGLRLALDTGSATAVLSWIELCRAGRGRGLSPRPPTDPQLAADLTDLRSVVARLSDAQTPAGDAGDLLVRQRELERSIHRRQLRTESTTVEPSLAAATVSRLRRALADGLLIELVTVSARLMAVTVDSRAAGVVDLGDAKNVYGIVTTLLSALTASVTPSTAARAAPRELLRRCLHEIDATIARAVRGNGPVVLVVPPALHVVPWQLLPCLSGRGVTVAPSATWWLAVQANPTPARGPAALVAGPRLVEADDEVRLIASSYPDATVLIGAAATADSVTSALADAPVAHIACHGRIRYDNPLWSSLEFHDGPMYVYDLERLPNTPAFVVLSGCETGVGVRAGDKLLGLSATFLEHGTRSLIASICPLPDSAATRDTMSALHRHVSRGVAPSAALAHLSANALNDEHALVASCLSCFGTG